MPLPPGNGGAGTRAEAEHEETTAMSDFINKAKDLAAKHGDQVTEGVDKATDVVDEKTGGKATDALQKVDDVTEKAVDALDGDK
jgi:hypothetical protein